MRPNPRESDLLFGEMAVKSRLVDPSHIRRCLEIQEREAPNRPLGQILVEQDLLTIGQLDHLIRTQSKKFQEMEERSQIDPREALFGRLAIAVGVIDQDQLHKALREQASIAQMRIFFRLGEILIKKELATAEQVKEILAMQQKSIVECPRCRSRFNLESLETEEHLVCKNCAGRLTLTLEGDPSVVVQETVQLDGNLFVALRQTRKDPPGEDPAKP